MRCDSYISILASDVSLFQSLLGFLMRCDLTLIGAGSGLVTMFQSLLGFLMRCDAGSDRTL